MPTATTLRWRPCAGTGLEQLTLISDGDDLLARSIVIGDDDGDRFAGRYTVRLSANWTFRSGTIELTDGRELHLAGEDGVWHCNGLLRPDLAGCVDIDLTASPFTNTLPLRRAPLAVGETRRFSMAFIDFARMSLRRDDQIYTRLGDRRYRFRAADGGFEAELTVDDDALVVSYPPLFERAD